ncbi:hypothetical protein [Oscillatoria sp. FACHB-1406]|uniref:hypothetical protein n=1 Tax=Oscillatoria sp. FACHB-1406 TaxID=2692846 RepID=UPI001687B1B7|nr:hypothetical protein [Oscillatoria sp. FACHB-1406]MBD2578351.1 hypothetical protein [Oscillatoria sp. FACHB-1406]
MVQPPLPDNTGMFSDEADVSRSHIYSVSQGAIESAPAPGSDRVRVTVEVDREVLNLIAWLAERQGMSPELALKKAVATAAYIYDITQRQGGKLLVHRKDNTVGEIVFK